MKKIVPVFVILMYYPLASFGQHRLEIPAVNVITTIPAFLNYSIFNSTDWGGISNMHKKSTERSTKDEYDQILQFKKGGIPTLTSSEPGYIEISKMPIIDLSKGYSSNFPVKDISKGFFSTMPITELKGPNLIMPELVK